MVDEKIFGNAVGGVVMYGKNESGDLVPIRVDDNGTSLVKAASGDIQNPVGTLIEGFETNGDWTPSQGTVEDNTANFKKGTKSQKLTPTVVNSNAYITKTFGAAQDLSVFNSFSLQAFLHNALTQYYSIAVYFFTNSSNFYWINAVPSAASAKSIEGWNKLMLPVSGFTASGSPSWSNITQVRVRINLNGTGSDLPPISFDDLRGYSTGKGIVLFTFDDGWESAYSQGALYLQSLGLKGTFYIIQNKIDTANYMTLANLAELYQNGHCLGNHTYDHTDLATLTADEVTQKWTRTSEWLESYGWNRGSRHGAYPNGSYDADVLAGSLAAGMRTIRSTKYNHQGMPFNNPYLLVCQNCANTVAASTIQGWIDLVKNRPIILILMLHKLVSTPSVSTEFSIADFRTVVDYAKAAQDADEIVVTTIDELYNNIHI